MNDKVLLRDILKELKERGLLEVDKSTGETKYIAKG